jgi:hypothetical protein
MRKRLAVDHQGEQLDHYAHRGSLLMTGGGWNGEAAKSVRNSRAKCYEGGRSPSC